MNVVIKNAQESIHSRRRDIFLNEIAIKIQKCLQGGPENLN